MRKPAVAGEFYEEDFGELDKQLKECFIGQRGPGDMPIRRKELPIKGIISPHAGYRFSGPCAAWGFKEVAERRFPDFYCVIGLNHFGIESGLSLEDWTTPFGMVRNAKDVTIALKDSAGLKIDEEVHRQEHSLEMQIPLLQYVSKDLLSQLRIVPIALGRDIDYAQVAARISATFKKLKVDPVYIISTDLTHYGRNYGYVPFTLDVPKRLNELDRGAIDMISKLDVQGFADYLNRTGITICGFMPILVFMSILKEEGYDKKGQLLMHYTSGDVLGDFTNSVSYASILFP